MSVIFKMSKFL